MYIMVNYENDYLWGEAQQRKIFPVLEKKWKSLRQQSRYAKYDALSEHVNMEIKSRKNLRCNSYPTTLLTMNKISDTTKTNVFIFNFVFDMAKDMSEIYYIEYDEEKFSKYEKKMFSRANIKADEKEYVYIPVGDLIFLHRDEYEKEKLLHLEKSISIEAN
jgi:hypothetical protein